MDGQHEQDRADDASDTGKKLGKAHPQAVGKLFDIRDDPADQISGRVRINKGKGKLLQMTEGSGAEILDNVVGNLVVDMVHQPLENSG